MRKIRNFVLVSMVTLCILSVVKHNAFGAVYTTVKGDSLFKISKVFSTNVPQIIKDNNLKSISIYPGQKLIVNSKTYTIKGGDTLYLISKKFGVTIDALKIANSNLSDKLSIGQVINIPTAVISTPKPTVNYSKADIDLLARLITAEAQGETYDAKVAVGAVVMNRIKSGIFPTTVKDVIYQKDSGYYQFTPVMNGWINKPADQSSITATYAAMSGNDPSKGALYYFDNTVTNKWLLSKPVLNIIGKLTFAL